MGVSYTTYVIWGVAENASLQARRRTTRMVKPAECSAGHRLARAAFCPECGEAQAGREREEPGLLSIYDVWGRDDGDELKEMVHDTCGYHDGGLYFGIMVAAVTPRDGGSMVLRLPSEAQQAQVSDWLAEHGYAGPKPQLHLVSGAH